MINNIFALSVVVVCTFCSGAHAARHMRQYENVLGTSMELQLECSESDVQPLEQAVFAELDRLKKVLSHYDSGSEVSQLLLSVTTGERVCVSRDLEQVLVICEELREASDGAFDLRAGAVRQLWDEASRRGQAPTEAERNALTESLLVAPYQLSGSSIVRADSLHWSLDGVAKGSILDAIGDRLEAMLPGLAGSINIGGDIKTLGNKTTSVGIENPMLAAENASPVARITLPANWSVCTSGSYRRGPEVAGRRLSHIFDPRSGLPTEHVISATVISKSAAWADGLATGLSVMPLQQSLRLINSSDATECCLVLKDGSLVTSAGWPSDGRHRFISKDDKLQASGDSGEKKSAKAASGLIVDFTLDRPKGRRYRRPYVAVWLEDKDGFPVKTAILWMQTEQPGPRWHRDLTRWYRNDRMRKAVEKTSLVDTVSGATRGAGEYQAVFDGTDNDGKALPKGKYTLCLEVAREHGTYQLIREKVELGAAPIRKTDLKGNVEMGKVSYRYVPKTAAEVQ